MHSGLNNFDRSEQYRIGTVKAHRANGRSSVGGYFFLGSLPQNGDPIFLNGNIAITCAIIKVVTASAAEAELAALFINAQEAKSSD